MGPQKESHAQGGEYIIEDRHKDWNAFTRQSCSCVQPKTNWKRKYVFVVGWWIYCVKIILDLLMLPARIRVGALELANDSTWSPPVASDAMAAGRKKGKDFDTNQTNTSGDACLLEEKIPFWECLWKILPLLDKLECLHYEGGNVWWTLLQSLFPLWYCLAQQSCPFCEGQERDSLGYFQCSYWSWSWTNTFCIPWVQH